MNRGWLWLGGPFLSFGTLLMYARLCMVWFMFTPAPDHFNDVDVLLTLKKLRASSSGVDWAWLGLGYRLSMMTAMTWLVNAEQEACTYDLGLIAARDCKSGEAEQLA